MKHPYVKTWLCAVVIASGAAGPVGAESSSGAEIAETRMLETELAHLRVELAQAKLALTETLRELDLLKEFLTTRNVAGQLQAWRQQRQTWENERAELAAERQRLELARQSLETAGLEEARAAEAKASEPAPPPDVNGPRWEVDYKIAPVSLDTNVQIGFIDPVWGDALLREYPDIDRKHILIKGTWQNRSERPWRYTFEIRVGDRTRRIIGRWRYQTPVLGPNELHTFEVKVPVADVGLITSYQIGNIEADQPAQGPASPAGPDSPKAPADPARPADSPSSQPAQG